MPSQNQAAQQQAPGRSQYWHSTHAHPSSQAGLQQQQVQQQMRDSGRGVGAGLMVGSPPQQPSQMGSVAGPPPGLAQTQKRLPPTQPQPPQSMFAGPQSQRPLEQGLSQSALPDRRVGMQPGTPHGVTANGHSQLPVGSPPPGAPHLMGVPQPSGMQQMPPQQQQNKRARQAPPLQTLESLDPQRDEMTQFAYQLMQQQQQEQQQQQQPKPVTPLLEQIFSQTVVLQKTETFPLPPFSVMKGAVCNTC